MFIKGNTFRVHQFYLAGSRCVIKYTSSTVGMINQIFPEIKGVLFTWTTVLTNIFAILLLPGEQIT